MGNISSDGSMILINSFDIAGDTDYRLYVQHTNGSPPVLVGHGAGAAFSQDGRWVAAIDPGHPENFFVIPAGVGEARTLHAPPGTHYIGVALFADDKHALITTASSNQTPQSAVQDLDSGALQSIGPKDRYVPYALSSLFPGPSPDGKTCIQSDGKGHYWLQSLESNSTRELSGITAGERIINWHADSNNLFVSHPDGINVQVYNLNLSTGQRQLWTVFAPQDKAARVGDGFVFITSDGARFAYESHRIYSKLFLAKGLR
jgi:Tol biopolymer transport system component